MKLIKGDVFCISTKLGYGFLQFTESTQFGDYIRILDYLSNLDKFYVHASPYSIPVYKKMGFIETGNMMEENGIKYLPMEMTIKHN